MLRIVQGGGDVGGHLAHHPDIAHVHITGSAVTHDAIVFGPGDDGRARKAAGTPLLEKPITSELGGVAPDHRRARPVVGRRPALPGRARRHDAPAQRRLQLRRRADRGAQLRTGRRRTRSSPNCGRPSRARPSRPAWYPGSDDRVEAREGRLPRRRAARRGRMPPAHRARRRRRRVDHRVRPSTSRPCSAWSRSPAPAGRSSTGAIGHREPRLSSAPSAPTSSSPRVSGARWAASSASRSPRCATARSRVNTWTGVGFLTAAAPWGAFPGHTARRHPERPRRGAQRHAPRGARAHRRHRTVPAVPALDAARRVRALPEAAVVRHRAFGRGNGATAHGVRVEAGLAEDARGVRSGVPRPEPAASRPQHPTPNPTTAPNPQPAPPAPRIEGDPDGVPQPAAPTSRSPTCRVYDFLFGGITDDRARPGRDRRRRDRRRDDLPRSCVGQIDAIAGALAARGLGVGDVVALHCARTCPRSSTVFHGILRVGRHRDHDQRAVHAPTRSPTQLARLRRDLVLSRCRRCCRGRRPAAERVGLADEHIVVLDGAEGHPSLRDLLVEGATRARRVVRPGDAPRRAAVLVGHDRAPQGRDAHPPQPRRERGAERRRDRRRAPTTSCSRCCRSSTSTA